jgi:selenocysteine lyase/cysteine desulfurase
MYQEHGIAGSTSGGFRLCPHIYNTKEHVERAVRGVKALKSLAA